MFVASATPYHKFGSDGPEKSRVVLCRSALVALLLIVVSLLLATGAAAPALYYNTLIGRGEWGGCSQGQGSSPGWCNRQLDAVARARALCADLKQEEKWALLYNEANAVPRLGLPAYNWWNEGLHGVARAGVATSFPQIIGLSSSFNTSLFHSVGRAIGIEARGLNNPLDGELYHGLTLWAPNVNLFRDARWGRGQETPGEDPFLTGTYAQNFVRGVQGDSFLGGGSQESAVGIDAEEDAGGAGAGGEGLTTRLANSSSSTESTGHGSNRSSDGAWSGVRGATGAPDSKKYLLASAALKHFAVYSSEGTGSFQARLANVAVVNPQDMADTYLPAFREGIELGHASGLMCAYDAVTYGTGSLGRVGTKAQHHAIPSCANSFLLNELARKEWGFEGCARATPPVALVPPHGKWSS